MLHRVKFLGMFLLLFTGAMRSDMTGLGANVNGTWSVKISIAGGSILGTAELTQSGNQVTGWFEPNGGESVPLSGALLSGRLVISTHPESRHRVAFDRCEVTAGGNRMKGIFYPGNGKIEFMRLRQPHLPRTPQYWHPMGPTRLQ